jgi:hypothetical protein
MTMTEKTESPNLSAKLPSTESLCPKKNPKQFFRLSHITAQAPRFLMRSNTRSANITQHSFTVSGRGFWF